MTMLSGPFSAAMAIPGEREGAHPPCDTQFLIAAVAWGVPASLSPPVRFQRRGYLLLGGEDSGHASAGRQGLHQPGPLGDQADAVLQRVNPRHAGRHELAHTVPQHGRRFDPPTLPERCQGVFQREQHRLRVARLIQKRSCLGIQKRKQRAVEFRGEQFRAALERRAEDRLAFIERAAHAGVLRALPGKEKGDAGRLIANYLAVTNIKGRWLGKKTTQSGGSFLPRAGRNRQTMGKMRAAHGSRVANIGQRRAR